MSTYAQLNAAFRKSGWRFESSTEAFYCPNGRRVAYSKIELQKQLIETYKAAHQDSDDRLL